MHAGLLKHFQSNGGTIARGKCSCFCVAHVQVLLDVLGLEELSDYLRLMCSSLQQHSRAVAAASTRPSTGSTAATAAGDPPGSSSILKTPGGNCVILPCRALKASSTYFKS